MVSGFVTSPEDQSRICLLEASPIRMASKSLMSIKWVPSLLYFRVRQPRLAYRADFFLYLFLGLLLRRELDVGEVAQRLVRGQLQLAGFVSAVLAFLDLLPRGLPRGRAQRSRGEVDAELLGRAEQF